MISKSSSLTLSVISTLRHPCYFFFFESASTVCSQHVVIKYNFFFPPSLVSRTTVSGAWSCLRPTCSRTFSSCMTGTWQVARIQEITKRWQPPVTQMTVRPFKLRINLQLSPASHMHRSHVWHLFWLSNCRLQIADYLQFVSKTGPCSDRLIPFSFLWEYTSSPDLQTLFWQTHIFLIAVVVS